MYTINSEEITTNFFFNFYFYFILLYNTALVLPYIYMNLPRFSWVPNPEPPSHHPPHKHLSGSSQCTSHKHPVSCIKPKLAIHFLHDSIHVSMPFSQIIPLSPSPTESKSLLYTEWSKPERKTPIQYTNTYIWNLGSWQWWPCMRDSKRDTDV